MFACRLPLHSKLPSIKAAPLGNSINALQLSTLLLEVIVNVKSTGSFNEGNLEIVNFTAIGEEKICTGFGGGVVIFVLPDSDVGRGPVVGERYGG